MSNDDNGNSGWKSSAGNAYQTSNELVIAGQKIGRDANGRHRLNDLHHAAGGLEKDKPANWAQLQQTKDLEAEILTAGNPAVRPIETKEGRYGGTFGVDEMAVAYASWISPAFHLLVIRAFLDLAQGRIPAGQPSARVSTAHREAALLLTTYRKVAKTFGLDDNQSLISANKTARKLTGIDLMIEVGVTHLTAPQQTILLTPTAIGIQIGGKSAREVNALLEKRGYQIRVLVSSKDAVWTPTKIGEPYAVMQDTGKRHSDGTPVRQLKWLPEIIALLTAALAGEAV